MKRVTQSTIAKALGLATSTVGLVVGSCETRSQKKLRPETVARIEAKAKELGYFAPDRRARAMRNGRSNLIGIIHFGSPFEAGQRAAFYLPQAVNAQGYDYLVVDLHWHGGNVERVMNEILQARVEGVLLTANYLEAFSFENLAILQKAGIPVVSLYGDDAMPIPHIGDAARGSFRALAEHVIALGYERILFPCGNSGKLSMKGRIAGLKDALPSGWEFHIMEEKEFFQSRKPFSRIAGDTRCMTVVHISRGGGTVTRANFRFANRLFSLDELPHAIMAFNDQAAFGVFNAAYEKGLRIPEDIALTGADDDRFGKYPMFHLTTIRQDIESSCDAALDALIRKIKTPDVSIPNREFPSQLVLRHSCGRSLPSEQKNNNK